MQILAFLAVTGFLGQVAAYQSVSFSFEGSDRAGKQAERQPPGDRSMTRGVEMLSRYAADPVGEWCGTPRASLHTLAIC